MAEETIFRIYAGDRYVDIKVATEGLTVKDLLEIREGDEFRSSVYLREPDSSRPDEIRSFLTAMKGIDVVKSDSSDAKINISLSENPFLHESSDELYLKLSKDLIEKPADRRRTLAGNLGLLYSLSLYLFEKKHSIISYHSSALVDEKKRLIFIIGGEASSGKSVIMLDFLSFYGTSEEYKVLSTEMGRLSINNGILNAYSGAFFDNISIFPEEKEKENLISGLFPGARLPDLNRDVELRGTDGSVKIPVSFKNYYTEKSNYSSKEGYKLVYLVPHIRVGNQTRNPILLKKDVYGRIFTSLLGVAREKLGQKQPSWMYEKRESLLLPADFLGREQFMESKTVEESLKEDFLEGIIEITGNPLDFNENPGGYWGKIAKLLKKG